MSILDTFDRIISHEEHSRQIIILHGSRGRFDSNVTKHENFRAGVDWGGGGRGGKGVTKFFNTYQKSKRRKKPQTVSSHFGHFVSSQLKLNASFAHQPCAWTFSLQKKKKKKIQAHTTGAERGHCELCHSHSCCRYWLASQPSSPQVEAVCALFAQEPDALPANSLPAPKRPITLFSVV